jgi:hypothetical protein
MSTKDYLYYIDDINSLVCCKNDNYHNNNDKLNLFQCYKEQINMLLNKVAHQPYSATTVRLEPLEVLIKRVIKDSIVTGSDKE